MVESVFWSSPLTAASVTIGVPIAPRDRHWRAEPRGALDDRSEGEGDQQHLEAAVEGDVDDRFLHDLELPRDDRHRVEEHRREHDPDDPEQARERPEGEGRHRRADGHSEGDARDEQRRDHGIEGRVRGGNAEVTGALLVAMRVERDEVEQREDRNRGDEGGEEDAPERVVVLEIHSNLAL
jgi:hypothetical protein